MADTLKLCPFCGEGAKVKPELVRFHPAEDEGPLRLAHKFIPFPPGEGPGIAPPVTTTESPEEQFERQQAELRDLS